MNLFEQEEMYCHKCGARGGLKTFTFGLARMSAPAVKKKDSEGCLLSILSLFLPFFASFGLVLLREESRFETHPEEILPLRLRVCRNCGPSFWRSIPYEAHPLWDEAHRLGFTKFLTAAEVSGYLSEPNQMRSAHPPHRPR